MSQSQSQQSNITRKISRTFQQADSAYLDNRVRNKLKDTQFPLTKTGWIKVVSTLFSVTGLILFLYQSWKACVDIPDWYLTLYPSCAGISVLVQSFFYLIFSCEATKKNPGLWIKADISMNLLSAVMCITGSTLITLQKFECKKNESIHNIPGPLGIVGGILQIAGCAAIFLLYRYVEEKNEDKREIRRPRTVNFRKSIQV